MSQEVIDEKVVSLKFDNKNFEKNAAQSLTTIQKIKQALNFKDAEKSLQGLEKASHSIRLNGISNSVEAIRQKFDGMEVAARAAITNITNSFVNGAKHWVSSVTIDPIKTGISVYEQKLNSVQTMLTNTGKTLQETNEILNELNEYSDKTIFSLNDMTTALSKFTAAGVDAKKAKDIIVGAANEAASMGAGSAEFSRFIYNLTQAYSIGKMTTIDWKSLENAGVAGMKFKEQLIESYEYFAKLGKVTDEYVGKVNATNLREFFQKGIITNDVMTRTFEKYAGLVEGFEDIGEAAAKCATQVKTFHQLMDVLAESVASTWSQSFGYIIGDFTEAKQLWTTVSNIFEATVGKMNENRNKLLEAWHEGFVDPARETKYSMQEVSDALSKGLPDPRNISGRTLLLEGLANILKTIVQIIKPIKEGFRELFPATTANNLWQATKNFRDFTAHLKLSEPALKEIKDAAKGVFSIMKFGSDVLKDIIHALIPASSEVDSLAVLFIKIAGAVGRFVFSLLNAIRTSDTYQTILQAITYYAKTALNIIGFLISAIANLFKAAKDSKGVNTALGTLSKILGGILQTVLNLIPAIVTVFKLIGIGVGSLLALLGQGLAKVEGFFSGIFGKRKDGQESGKNIIAGVAQGISENSDAAQKAVKNLAKGITNTFENELDINSPSKVFIAIGGFIVAGLVVGLLQASGNLEGAIDTILGFFTNLGSGISSGLSSIKEAIFGTEDAASGLVEFFRGITQKMSVGANGLMNTIASGFSNFTKVLSNLNWASIVTIGIITVLLGAVIKIVATFYKLGDAVNIGMKAAKNITNGFNNFSKAFNRMHSPLVETLKGIAICILGIAAALWLLATLQDTGKLWSSLAALLGSFLAIMTIATLAAKIAHKNDLDKDIKNLALMILSISGSFMLMGMAFSLIMQTINENEKGWDSLIQAAAVFASMAVIMLGVAVAINRFSKEGNLSAILSILVWSFSLSKVIKAMTDLVEVGKGLTDNDIKGLWLGGILPVFTMMIGMALMGAGFKNVGVGSTLFILVLLAACKKIFEAIKDLKVSIDPALLEWLNRPIATMKDVLTALGVALIAISAIIVVVLGPRIDELAKALIKIAIAIGAMILVAKVAQTLQITGNDILRVVECAGILSVMCLALGLLALATKDTELKQVSNILNSVALVLATMGALAYVMKDLDTGHMIAVIASLVIVFTGMFFLIAALTHLQKDVKPQAIWALVAGLLIIIGGLILITNYCDPDKLWNSTISLALVMAALAAVMLAMSRIKDTPLGPIIAVVVGIGVIAGALWILSQYSFEELMGPMVAMSGVMAVLALVLLSMKNLDSKAIGPALVSCLAIVAVGGALVALSYFQWDGIMDAAFSMAIVLGAVAACLYLMSQAGKGGSMAVASASILIVAGSLIVMAYAINQINGIDWNTTLQAISVIGALTLCLALLGSIGAMVVVGAAGLLVASAALIVVAFGLQQFLEIDWDQLGKAGAAMGVLTILVAILSLLGPVAIMGAAGLLIASIGLIAVAKAMQMFAEVPDGRGGGWLSGLAGALMLVAIAGVLLIAGAPGLIAAAPGLIGIALAMQMFGKVKKAVNGSRISGLAGGLMLMAVAGILLLAGGTGLILGGVGLLLIGAGLKAFNNIKIGGDELASIGEALMSFALAGVIGIIGGPGLILLSAGITAMAGALNLLASVVERVINFDLGKVAEDSVSMGGFIVEGLANGITSGFGFISKVVGGLAGVVENTFRNIMGIHSASDTFIELGKWILAGLAEGLGDIDLNQGIGDIMKQVADNVVGSFGGELGSGLGKIDDILKKFTTKSYKSVYKKIADHAGAGGGELWGWVTEEAENSLFSDGLFGNLTDELKSMFDVEGWKDALELNDIIGEDVLAIKDMDFAAGGLGNSLDGLAGDLDEVTDSNNKMTDSMGKSADRFKEFDRSVVTTSREIQKNILNYIVSEEEWKQMAEEAIAAGFDPQMVLDQGIKAGKETGYAWLKGILGAFHGKKLNNIDLVGEDFKTWLNDQFALASQTDKGMEEFTAMLEKLAKGEITLAEANVKLKKNMYHMDGSLYNAYEGYDPSTVQGMTEDENEHTKAVIKAAEAYNNYYDRQAEIAKNSDSIINSDTQNIADLMVSEMTDAIKSAINYYMPAEGFVQLGVNICKGLAAGIYAGKYLSVKAISMSAEEIIKEFENATKIASPSKVFYQLGDYLMQGLANGISDTNDPQNSTKDLAKNLTDTFQTLMADILGVMESDEEFTPTIRPVVDFSNIQASASEAQRLFDGTNVSLAGTEFSNYKASLQTPQSNVMSMSKDEFQSFLNTFANTIVEGVNSGDKNVTVDVNLEGDAKGMFKVVREQNNAYKRATGYSAFV